MIRAYIDSSVLLAVLLEEPGAGAYARKVSVVDLLVASNLVEAELRSACSREGIQIPSNLLTDLKWIVPRRSLAKEYQQVLSAGDLRGADLLHVASALHFFQEPAEGLFLTLDKAQRDVAQRLGFSTDWSFTA